MSARSWPKAYTPLGARTLAWQFAVLLAAEIALYSSYATHEARFHWATHFLVGLTVASLWRAAFLLVAARPTRFQLLSRLGTRFDLAEQADAVLRLLDHHGIRRAHLVGHSWGSVVAGAVATRGPERVERLTLVTPAVFADVRTAQARLAGRSWLARVTLSGSPLGGFVCGAMCLLRPVLARVTPRLEPDVPEDVARSGVQHSFAAYSDGLHSMWDDNPLVGLLRQPPCPVTVVLTQDDSTVLASDVLGLRPSPQVRIVRLPGGHGIAYDQPDAMAAVLLDQLDAAAAPSARRSV